MCQNKTYFGMPNELLCGATPDTGIPCMRSCTISVAGTFDSEKNEGIVNYNASSRDNAVS